jgi:hypothetical protein
MDPTASFLNVYLSIEKFLFSNLVTSTLTLLVSMDETDVRLSEIEAVKGAILWQIPSGFTDCKCSLTLFVGGTFLGDAGNIKLLTLLDTIKHLFEKTGSIPVYQYTNDIAGAVVNQLAIMRPVRFLPLVTEPNLYKTRFITVKLNYGQIVT